MTYLENWLSISFLSIGNIMNRKCINIAVNQLTKQEMIKRVREQSGVLDAVQPAVNLLETDIANFARESPTKLSLANT